MSKVFLDANILYSGTCRSLFIWLHVNRAVEMYWSQEAWDEVFRNFAEKNDADKSARFKSSMQKNAIDEFPECMISPGSFTPVGLKDRDDEHILAAAVVAGADFLLTNDIVLLGEALPTSLAVKIMKPDDFLVDVASLKNPESVKQSVHDHIQSLKSKPSRIIYSDNLTKSGLGKFAQYYLLLGDF
jgi:predicted nucleic acid-binding protein